MAAEDQEELEAMPRAISVLSWVLERVAEANDKEARRRGGAEGGGGKRISSSSSSSAFEGLTRPTISIHSYLRRIFKYANCSASCFVVAYAYLDRFARRQPSLPINSFNVHRLLVTSVMLSAKFMDDMYYNNAYYAKVGGISTTEMNLLELDFLFGLSFQLNVTPDTFHTYCSYLHREMLLHSPLDPSRPLKPHYCYNEEDESKTHQKELAV